MKITKLTFLDRKSCIASKYGGKIGGPELLFKIEPLELLVLLEHLDIIHRVECTILTEILVVYRLSRWDIGLLFPGFSTDSYALVLESVLN